MMNHFLLLESKYSALRSTALAGFSKPQSHSKAGASPLPPNSLSTKLNREGGFPGS